MGPRKPRTFAVALIIKNATGEMYEFPYIEYGTNRFDGQAVVLSNAQQKIPFHCEEILYPDGRATFSWTFTIKTFRALHEQLRFQRALIDPAQVIFRDLDDGLEHFGGVLTLEPATLNYPIEIVSRVLDVQQRTRTPIPLPKRNFFTSADLDQLAFIEAILKDGRQPRPPHSFGVKVGSEEARALLREIVDRPSEITHFTPLHVETLLDVDIPLGPAEISCNHVIPSTEDAARLRAFLDDESPSYPQQFRLIPAPGAKCMVRYSRWEKSDGSRDVVEVIGSKTSSETNLDV